MISEVAKQRIRAIEVEISRNNYETAVAFDTDGNIVFEKWGMEDDVAFTYNELEGIRGCILTHNHTYDEKSERHGVKSTSSFSSDDLYIALQKDLIEVRMVINDEFYSFQWNNPDKRTAEHFLYEMDTLEFDAQVLINTAKEKSDSATAEFETNPSLQSYIDMVEDVVAFYTVYKAQYDKINDYISSNQHIGYTFRKECV
jgi:hypothetical protein